METNHRTAPNLSHEGSDKNTKFQAQAQRVLAAFTRHPQTMLMVSIETGVLRANICRYVAEWKKQNRIRVVLRGICPISKHGRVQFLKADREQFPAIVEHSNTVKP
jgi:hypothetical protein